MFFEKLFQRKYVSGLVALLPGLSLLIWYLVAKQPTPGTESVAPSARFGFVRHLEYKFYTLSKMGPFHNLVDWSGSSLAGRSHYLYLAGVGLNIVFAIFLCVALIPPALRAGRRTPANPLFLSALVLLLAFLVLPSKTAGVINLGERFLYPCVILLMFLVGGVKHVKCLAGFGVCGILLTSFQMLSMQKANRDSSVADERNVTLGNEDVYVKYGFYDSRLYGFDAYRVFLRDPAHQQMPSLVFDTSLLVNRSSGDREPNLEKLPAPLQ